MHQAMNQSSKMTDFTVENLQWSLLWFALINYLNDPRVILSTNLFAVCVVQLQSITTLFHNDINSVSSYIINSSQ